MLHKHIAKHAKRAHAHVQDHGHKWLRLLSGVFFFILIYPYFSNAQVPTDLCPNIAEVQESLPENSELDGENCICSEGFEFDEENNCVEIQEQTPTDLCTNIDWDQESLPENSELDGENCICSEGFEFDEENNCIEAQEELDPVDLCPNIDEVQETIPEWQELNDNNECVEIQEEWNEDEVIALTGTITYNPATGTTGTVTATVTWFSTTGVTITSTGGANHIFTENGTFVFLFENELGTTGQATATVDWITAEQNLLSTEECELEITNPTSGAIVSEEFNIVWTSEDCDEDQEVTIQLRDHNDQWIDLGTGDLGDEIFNFDSNNLASTGLYTITGTHLSGSQREEVNGSGVVIATGTYTQDTPYIVYTWDYTGQYTDYATGYIFRIVDTDETILAESDATFIIDNQKPILTSLTGSFAPLFTWYVGKAGIMTASFVANEQLTWGTTFTILGTNVTPTSVVQNGSTYSYTLPLSSIVASGALAFTAHVTDLAGNTGAIYGTSSIILNTRIPAITNFTFATGTASGSINLSWNTDTGARYNLSFYKSGTTGTTYFTGTTYGTSHTYTMTNIQNGQQYPFIVTVLNNVNNNSTLQGTLHKSATGALSISLQSSNDILQLSGQAETNLYLQILQNEINKFQVCKAAITFTNQTIPVGNKSVVIKIPTITSNSVKQTMLTFLLLFTNKVQEKTTLSQAELNIVADAVNNFLVVIKLVDDDENYCEQKMSTYYLSQFEQLMSSMSFF